MSFLLPKTNLPTSQVDTPQRQANREEGEALPFGYGRHRLGLRWMTSPWNRFEAGEDAEKMYYASLAGALGIGPIDYVGGYWFNGKQVGGWMALGGLWQPGWGDCRTLTLNASADYGMKGAGDEWRVRIYRGSDNQAPDSLLNASAPKGTGQSHPAYPGIAYSVWENCDLSGRGRSSNQIPNLEVEVGWATPDLPGYTETNWDETYGVHPIAAIYGFLTHPRVEPGIHASLLAEPAYWGEKAQQFYHSGIGGRNGRALFCAPLVAQTKTVDSVISEVLQYFGGFLYQDDGVLRIGWAGEPTTVAIPEITEHDLMDLPKAKAPGDQDAVASVTVSYFDIVYGHEEMAETVPVPVSLASTGEPRTLKVERPFLRCAEAARWQAHRSADDANEPDSSYGPLRIGGRLGRSLRPGQLVQFDYNPWGLDILCRVESISDPGEAVVEIGLKPERGAVPTPYVAPADPRTPIEIAPPHMPTAADYYPWFLPSGFGDARQVAVLCARPDFSQSAVGLWLAGAAAGPWSYLGLQRYFAVRATVSGAATAAAGTVTVVAASPDAISIATQTALAQGNDTLCMIVETATGVGSEVLSIGTVSVVEPHVFALSVLRGRQGTAAAAIADGAAVWIVARASITAWQHGSWDDVYDAAHAYSAAVATKVFRVQYATVDAEGIAGPDVPRTLVLPDITFLLRRVVLYCYARPPLGGVPPNPDEWYDELVGPLPFPLERGYLSGLVSNGNSWRETPPSATLTGFIDMLTTGDFIGASLGLGPPAMWTCSCEVMASGAITADSYSPVVQSAPVATSKAQLNESGNRLADLRPTDDESGWSTPIYYSDVGYIQLRKNATSGNLEWTPDGGVTVQPMGGGGGASPTTTKGDLIVRGADADERFPKPQDGQVMVADSTQPLGWRAATTSDLPAPAGTGAVLVNNGSTWYVLQATAPNQALVTNAAGVPVWAAVSMITYDPNAGQIQIQGTTIQCTWTANGDGNDIFYALGTNIRRKGWANPKTYGAKLLCASNGSSADAFLTALVDRAAGSSSCGAVAGGVWLTIDLGSLRQAAIESYSIQGGSANFPRTLKIQGSNNCTSMAVVDIVAATWVDIDVRTNDTTIAAALGWGHWSCNGDSTTRFRWIRYLVTADSGAGTPTMTAAELALYGPCTIITQSVSPGTYALTRVSNGDGNGLIYLLGTLGLRSPFQNPIALGLVAWIWDASPTGGLNADIWFDRAVAPSNYATWPSTTTGCWVVDLGPTLTMSISQYSFYQPTADNCPRSWRLEGMVSLPGFTMLDVEAANWVAIDVRAGDTTINGAGWFTFTANGDTGTRFRYLRIANRGANSSNSNAVRISEVEFYGSLRVM